MATGLLRDTIYYHSVSIRRYPSVTNINRGIVVAVDDQATLLAAKCTFAQFHHLNVTASGIRTLTCGAFKPSNLYHRFAALVGNVLEDIEEMPKTQVTHLASPQP